MFTSETKTATITNAVATSTEITYTSSNTFSAGDIVHISGINPYQFNIPDAEIYSATSTSFVVKKAIDTSISYNTGGTAVYDELKNHTMSTSVINVNSLTIAEINMNASSNITEIGNYRYRPTTVSPTELNFGVVKSNWVKETSSSSTKYYYGATDADVIVDGGLDDENNPYLFVEQDQKTKSLISLESCFGRYRPRSGINKLMWLPGRNINYSNSDTASRPRYYAASPNDNFKYWISYRTENNGTTSPSVFGLSKKVDSDYVIEDVAPFVVYDTHVPANRIVVKMQTHVGSIGQAENDPFYGDENKSTPIKWKIQTLTKDTVDGDVWTDSWTQCWDTPSDIVPNDGYVEIQYGLTVPTDYSDVFVLVGEYATVSYLPVVSTHGYGYLVGASETSSGNIYVWDDNKIHGAGYIDTGAAEYSWRLGSDGVTTKTPFATKLVEPDFFVPSEGAQRVYREFDFIDGLRIVVETMNKDNATFDLIELSPRLAINLSDKVSQFSITKQAADLGNAAIPVGQLLAATGKLSLFDYDQAFNSSQVFSETQSTVNGQIVYGTSGSVIYNFIPKNLQVKFYEVTKDVGNYDYYIPLKTLFCEGFPETNIESRSSNLDLRDQFIQFESFIAPELFIPNVSLSVAVSMMLDSIGFSNYIFKRVEGTPDPIIPFFYVAPNKSVAEVLQDLAVSTQHAMFFDEFNNLVVMSKEYIMPKPEDRDVDFVVYGSKDYSMSTGESPKVKNNNKKLSNIIQIATQNKDIYNDGKITFSEKSIQKAIATVQEANGVDKARRYIYKPVLLWEAQPSSKTKTINGESGDQSALALTAIPLNSDIPATPPEIAAVSTISSVSETTSTITYTTSESHSFVVGDTVTISDIIPSLFNVTNAQITETTSDTFTIKKSTAGITGVQVNEPAFTGNGSNGKLGKNYPEIGPLAGRVRYFAKNSFAIGDTVKITGLTPDAFNGTTRKIINVFADYFDVQTDTAMDLEIADYWTRRETDIDATLMTVATGTVEKAPRTYISGGKAQVIRNETIDLGQGAYFLPRYDGYLYANGEIIRYKGIEFTIQGYGNVWILNNEDYQYYFNKLQFGKKIFPTGRIRIYAKFDTDGNIIRHGRAQFGTKITQHLAKMSDYWSDKNNIHGFEMESEYIFTKKTLPATEIGAAANSTANKTLAKNGALISNKIKNILITNIPNEDTNAKPTSYSSAQGSVQSSALVFRGVPAKTLKDKKIKPRDFITYIPKTLDTKYVHFGTRMRIIGSVKQNESAVDQVIDGSTEYYSSASTTFKIDGGGGGIAFMLDSTSAVNTGYFFELSALSYSGDKSNANDAVGGNNIFFYKVMKDSSGKAIPVNLWQGLGSVIVDDGEFVGQNRQTAVDYETVYDLAVEYKDFGKKWRRFYLYINDTLIAIYDDKDPLPITSRRNQIAPFVRGSSKVMFENIYAMRNNYAFSPDINAEPPGRNISPFQDNNLTTDTALHKFALSGIIKDTMLSRVGKSGSDYAIYFEEFGTIMRECMYFDVKFDKAYPSLSSKISPTMNVSKGLVVSSFVSNAYGAEFLAFNATDNVLNLDASTGNYLRIQGVTINQDSQNVLTVDSYYDRISDFSGSSFQANKVATADATASYLDIKQSRSTYGVKQFNLSATYIQDRDAADNIMSWILSKTIKPRKAVGLRVFGLPYVQLGDIVNIDYTDKDGISQVSDSIDSRYVVYSIEYTYSADGPETIVYLSEVV